MASRRNRKYRALAKLAIVLGLIGLIGGGLWYFQKHRGMDDALREGKDALNAGDYPRAMSRLSYYVSKDKTNPDALFSLALARKHVKTEGVNYIDRAAQFARAALDLAPDRVDIMEELLTLYSELGRASEVINISERLLAIDSKNKRALTVRTEALNATGKAPEALDNELKTAEYYPDDFEVHQRIILLMDIVGEDRQKILQYIERLQPKFGALASYWSTQAQFLTSIGDNDRAVLMAKKAAAIPPRDPAELTLVLNQLSVERTIEPELTNDSHDVLERVITTSSDRPEMLFTAIARAYKEGETELFAQGLGFALARIKDATPVDLIYLIIGANNTTNSSNVRETALNELKTRSDPEVPDWLIFVQAWDTFARGEIGPARQLVDQIKSADLDPQLLNLLEGRISQALNEPALARTHLEQVAIDPAWHIARRDLAVVRLQQGDSLGVIQLARIDPKLGATTGGITIIMAAHVERAERIDATQSTKVAAARLFSTIMPEITDAPPSLVALQSRALLAAGDIRGGLRIARELATTNPPPEAFVLVSLADKTRQHDEEITTALLDRARDLYPDSAAVAFARAVDVANRGDVEAGRAILKDALAKAKLTEQAEVTSLSAIFESRFNPGTSGQMALVEASRKLPDDIGAQLALLSDQNSWNSREYIGEAIERLRKLTGENATGWRVYKTRELLLFGKSEADTAQASRYASEVLRDDPTNIDARVLAGDAWLRMGDRTRAIEQYRAAAELGGQGIATYPGLIELLLFDGQRTEAERYMRLFMQIEILPDDLTVARGLLASQMGMTNEAEPDLLRGVEIGDETAGLELIRNVMRRDNRARAQQIVDTFLAREGDPLPSMLAIAADLAALDRGVDAGLSVLDRLPNDAPNYLRTIAYAELLNRFGQIDRARQTMQPLHEQGLIAASTLLARLEIESKNYEQAKEIVVNSLAKHPNNPELKRILSRIELASGNDDALAAALYDMAQAAASNSIELPGTTQLLSTLERLFKKQISKDTALLEVRRITADAPTNFDGWRVLAILQMDAEKFEDAAKSAHAAAAAAPTDPRAQEFAARTLQVIGRLEEARTIGLSWAKILGAQSMEADCFLASIESSLGNPKQAYEKMKPWIERIRTLGNSDQDKIYLLGVILAQNGDTDGAAAALWPQNTSDVQAVLRYLTAVNVFTQNTQAARTWIKRAEPVLSQIPDGRLAIADKWYKISIDAADGSGDLRNVIAMLDGHIESMSQPDMAYLMLAAAHQALNELDQAENAYRKSLEIQPNNTKAMNNLAYLLITRGTKLSEAITVAQRAVDLARTLNLPNQELAAYHDTLGLAMLRNNQPRNALDQFEKSMTLNTSSGSAAIGLAEAYLALGQPSDARNAISRFDRLPELARSLAPEEQERLNAVQSELRSQGR